MSTWLYLECSDHTPPIQAHDESGQHSYDLPRIHTEIVDRAALVDAYTNDTLPEFRDTHRVDDYYSRHSARFLAQHPNCNITVRDEYGREHPVPDLAVTIDNRANSRVPHVQPWTYTQVRQLPGQARTVNVLTTPGRWESMRGRAHIIDTLTEGRETDGQKAWPATVTLHLRITVEHPEHPLRDLFTQTEGRAGAAWRRGTGDDLEVMELWPAHATQQEGAHRS